MQTYKQKKNVNKYLAIAMNNGSKRMYPWAPSDRCERAEEGDHIFTNKTEDLQQETKSPFYVLY